MNITEPFVRRPVATTLLTIGVALAGIVSFGLLPISPLPQIDFPVARGLPRRWMMSGCPRRRLEFVFSNRSWRH